MTLLPPRSEPNTVFLLFCALRCGSMLRDRSRHPMMHVKADFVVENMLRHAYELGV